MTEAVTPPNSAGSAPPSNRAVVNTPDPTLLTIDSIRREIATLENLFDVRLKDAEKLRNEKFSSIDKLMDRAEELRKEQKADTKSAVDAALHAQVEATAKMERSISEQIASLRSNFETEIRGIRTVEDDLKGRMTAVESVKQGQSEQRSESRQMSSGVIATVVGAFTILVAILSIYAFVAGSGT